MPSSSPAISAPATSTPGRPANSRSPNSAPTTSNPRRTPKSGKSPWFKSQRRQTLRQVRTDLKTTKSELDASIPAARLEVIPNPSPSAQHSLVVDAAHGLAVAQYLRYTARFDYCSNVTG